MTHLRSPRVRALLVPAVVSAALVAPGPAVAASTPATSVQERSGAVAKSRVFRLARPATHVAIHWRGARKAHVDVAFSRDGRRFGRLRHVHLDEIGLRARRETYGQVMVAHGARAVRVVAERPLRRVTVVGFADRGRGMPVASAAGHVATTGVIPRSGWGADESLRFDRRKREIWPPEYHDVQKLVVHHTAGQNDDPDPAATVRSIYHYHAVTQGWGDIGYNFLVDEAGRVYEGRYSGPAGERTPPVDPTPGEDDSVNGVTAGHAYGYNAGTVGVALLGTLTSEAAAAAARTTLEELLAWGAERHALDPLGSGAYTNPVTGTVTPGLANLLGHRDVSATECPGEILYGELEDLRADTALRASVGSSQRFGLQAAPQELKVVRGGAAATTQLTLDGVDGFGEAVALDFDGLPSGATVALSQSSISPGGSATVSVIAAKNAPTGAYLLRVQGTFHDPETGLRETRATPIKVQIARR